MRLVHKPWLQRDYHLKHQIQTDYHRTQQIDNLEWFALMTLH